MPDSSQMREGAAGGWMHPASEEEAEKKGRVS